MTDITAAFFAAHPAALPLYECLEARILAEIPGTRVEVRKTQINFSNAHLFACVSFLPLRPPAYLVVSFGLGYRAVSPRIAAVAEPRPNRWDAPCANRARRRNRRRTAVVAERSERICGRQTPLTPFRNNARHPHRPGTDRLPPIAKRKNACQLPYTVLYFIYGKRVPVSANLSDRRTCFMKKLLIALIALCMALPLAACGNETPPPRKRSIR